MNVDFSAVIVAVPEVESLIGRFRTELDASARDGVPAHITILFPFLPPAELDDTVLADLAAIVATVPAFPVVFRRVGWFGSEAVWLAPEPAAPFVTLITAVHERFGIAPYGGAFDDVTPHLTIGHKMPMAELRAAAAAVAPSLPVHAAVGSARLIVGVRGLAPWRTVAEFPLGHGART